MKSSRISASHHRCHGVDQRGVVLIVALIVLVAMTLAGIALMRSTSTSGRVAGNLAFQQAATLSADVGIENAIAWLETNSAGNTLYAAVTAEPAYVPNLPAGSDPASDQSWETWWNQNAVATGRIHTMDVDPTGNQVSYIIQRLCAASGSPTAGIGCSVAPGVVGSEGNSKGSGVLPVKMPSQQYYRITARVAGPRNAVGFVQAVVAM